MEENSQPEEKTEEAKGNNKNLYYILVPVVLLLIVGGWYMTRKNVQEVSQESNKSAVTNTPTKAEENKVNVATDNATTGKIKEITVEGSEFSFKPQSIDLTKGEKVKLTFKNTGRQPHNFVIDELEIETKTIQSGKTDTVEFTVEDSGTFEFYCSVGQHKELGMKGEMEVE